MDEGACSSLTVSLFLRLTSSPFPVLLFDQPLLSFRCTAPPLLLSLSHLPHLLPPHLRPLCPSPRHRRPRPPVLRRLAQTALERGRGGRGDQDAEWEEGRGGIVRFLEGRCASLPSLLLSTSSTKCRRGSMANWAWSVAELSISPSLIHHLVPTHYAPRLLEKKGIDVNAFQPVNLGALRAVID